MQERRRFLQVLSGSMMAAGVGCGSNTSEGTGGRGGATGTTGVGGSGGSGGASSSSSSSSSASSSSSTSSSSSSASSSGTGCVDPAGTNVGMPSAFATNGLHKVPGTLILIGRDDGGLYARTSKCTHQGCDLNTKGAIIASGVHCNCHGGEFDKNGKATKTPATGSLKAYEMALGCDGSLIVNTAKVVTADVRLMA